MLLTLFISLTGKFHKSQPKNWANIYITDFYFRCYITNENL